MALIVASSLAIAVYTWFSASLLLPLAQPGRPVEYLFLGAPILVPLIVFGMATLLLVVVHARTVARRHPKPWSCGALDYLTPALLLAVAPLGALVLLPGIAWSLPVLVYVLVDLRVWWTVAIVIAVIWRFDARIGSPLLTACAALHRRLSENPHGLAAEGALLLVLMAAAVASNSHLRFTATLHGDEPKYIRYCESFYQGLGVEVGHQKEFGDLTLAYSPPVWQNAVHFARAIPAEASNLVSDLRTFISDPGHDFNRGRYADAWFFYGKDGGFYQVHNPGLPALIFPAYFLDRHFIAISAGYQRVFPGQLPATNLALLMIWAVWGVMVYRLLVASTDRVALSWLLAGTAMLTMPVAAFPFQVYPETIGGLIVTSISLWLLFRRPDESSALRAAMAGAASAFLPWLHIRMVLVSFVFFAAAMLTLGRRRVPFAAMFVVVIAALCLYSYHLTGSLRPDSMYATEGTPSPWTLAFALESAGAIPFDRIWGFFPHAIVYLLAICGWVPFFRERPRAALLSALLILGLVGPAAGHGFSAAGATPLRQSVAVIPLVMLPVAWTLMTFGARGWLRVCFALLLLLSLDSAWSYNRDHIKETGRMVDAAVSGWTPNLLFPWMHGTPWAEWRGTFVLFLLWVGVALTLLGVSIVAKRSAAKPQPVTLVHVVLATIAFIVIGTGATALGGEWTRGDYFVPTEEARKAAASYAARIDRCRTCYSSLRGEIGRSDILADADVQFDFGAEWGDMALGEETRFHAVATRAGAPGWGTIAIDFGDGETTRVDVFGRAVVPHVYKSVGVRKAVARFAASGRPGQQFTAQVSIRPVAISMSEVDGLPGQLKAAPERGSLGRVLLGPHGLVADGAGVNGTLWVIAWDGQRWQAKPAAMTSEISPGTWVALLRADAESRTAPLMFRWPNPAVTVGTPVVMKP